MSTLRLLTLPYHLGREGAGMGAGPDRFVGAGAVSRAEERGLTVELESTRCDEPFQHEIGATFAVLRAHAQRVGTALSDGAFPLTLGGNCSTTIATVAALGGADRLGVAWFDAHGDANTPETTTSGFLDGMPLAVLAGWCWRSLAGTVAGFEPLPEANLLHAAGRDIDAGEQRRLDRSDITVVRAEHMRTVEQLQERFLPAIDALLERVDRIYVHVDLDAIDLADGHANEFAAPGGPTLEALTASLGSLIDTGSVVAASLTSYNPDSDEDGRALRSGLRLLDTLASAARR